MARLLWPKTPGLYDLVSDALDGDTLSIAFEEPVPYALELWPPPLAFGGDARVSSRNMPTKLRLRGRKQKLPDFMNQYHMLLVNQRFVDVVEGFQKDVQYFPVECFWKDGSSASQFFFFTTVLLYAVIRDKTTAKHVAVGCGNRNPARPSRSTRPAWGDTHMWVDPHMPTKGPLVSDKLFDALKIADIRWFHDDKPPFPEV